MNTVEKLNQLLINYQVHYQNLRGFHWNVKGPMFFTLHDKFEELYTEAAVRIDEVAERILALGGTPVSALNNNALQESGVKFSDEVIEAKAMVEAVLAANLVLIKNVTDVLQSADSNNDEGTLDLFTSYVSELEKQNWMLRAFLN